MERIWKLINYISNSQLYANMGQVSDQAGYSGVVTDKSCFSFCCSLEEYIIQGKDSFLIDPDQKLLYTRQTFAKQGVSSTGIPYHKIVKWSKVMQHSVP